MEVSHQKCPNCNHNGCFSYNTDKKVWNCFSCGYSNGKNYGRPYFVRETADNIIEEEGYQLGPYFRDYRGLTSATIEKAGAYFTKTPDGKETIVYTYPTGVKYRSTDKKEFRASGQLDTFWGQDSYNGGGGTITITEGENDRMAVIQMMGDYPCVSVPGATPSKDFWRNAQDYLAGFEKIVLSVDNDDPGNKLADKFYRMFPGKVYRVPHTKFKDAHEFLENGALKEYRQAWFNAQKMKPDGFTSSADQWEHILRTEVPYEYFPTPVEELNKKIRGFVKGGITLVKATPGTGKTSIFRKFQHHLLTQSKLSIGVLHMEEVKATTARGLVTYQLNLNVNTIEDAQVNGVSEDQVAEVLRELTKDERFITFEVDSTNPVESVIEGVRILRQVYAVDYVFLDHLQRLAYLSGVDNATSSLTELAVKLVDMTKKENFGLIAISHVSPDGHTKYAKSLEEEAIIVLELERDKDSDDPDERDTTKITVTKNRPFSLLGYAGAMHYDQATTTVSEKIFCEPKGVSKGEF